MIRVAGIVPESITDGVGIRFALFLQGCHHNCEGCHNQSALPIEGGTEMSETELLEQIEKNPLLQGITFSGGEPFLQSEQLLPLARELKKRGYHLAAYTGYEFEELISSDIKAHTELLKYLDIVVDGKFILSKRDLTLKFRGSDNQRFIDVQKSLKEKRTVALEDWT